MSISINPKDLIAEFGEIKTSDGLNMELIAAIMAEFGYTYNENVNIYDFDSRLTAFFKREVDGFRLSFHVHFDNHGGEPFIEGTLRLNGHINTDFGNDRSWDEPIFSLEAYCFHSKKSLDLIPNIEQKLIHAYAGYHRDDSNSQTN